MDSYHFDMKSSTKDYNYALRLPPEDAAEINQVCRQNRTSFNKVVTLCVRKALPSVRDALAAEKGRITNVEPLPDRVLKRLYSEPDDDADSIALFMAAQSKAIDE
jgi:hypothetical protein